MAIFLDYLRCDIVNILVPTPHKSQTKANTVNRASREHRYGEAKDACSGLGFRVSNMPHLESWVQKHQDSCSIIISHET